MTAHDRALIALLRDVARRIPADVGEEAGGQVAWLCDLAEREAARADALALALDCGAPETDDPVDCRRSGEQDCADCNERAYARALDQARAKLDEATTGEADSNVALDNVSAALADAGVPVPDDPARYGEAIEALRTERNQVRHALCVVLPMAKGYAYAHDVGRNKEMVAWADDVLCKTAVGDPSTTLPPQTPMTDDGANEGT